MTDRVWSWAWPLKIFLRINLGRIANKNVSKYARCLHKDSSEISILFSVAALSDHFPGETIKPVSRALSSPIWKFIEINAKTLKADRKGFILRQPQVTKNCDNKTATTNCHNSQQNKLHFWNFVIFL